MVLEDLTQLEILQGLTSLIYAIFGTIIGGVWAGEDRFNQAGELKELTNAVQEVAKTQSELGITVQIMNLKNNIKDTQQKIWEIEDLYRDAQGNIIVGEGHINRYRMLRAQLSDLQEQLNKLY